MRVPVSCAVPRRASAERELKAKAFEVQIVGLLHSQLSGLTGIVSRSAKCWQTILRGERPATLRDLTELAYSAQPKARIALRAVAQAILDVLEPAASPVAIEEAAAAFTREAADVPAAVLRAKRDDGRVTESGAAEILQETLEAARALECVYAALPRREGQA